MKTAMLTAATILALPALALAADKCADAVDQVTMNACADAAFKQSDKKLNELYRQIEARLKDDAGTKKLLVQAYVEGNDRVELILFAPPEHQH
jgi:uncharacterized protein YecT (DUF1311 family)